ncbi:MAG: helix-turn-helix domain-containing protein, partial [Halochromatium sp.]
MLNARRPRPAQPRRLRAGELRNEAEWLLIDAALKAADYNRSRAAKLLG